MLAAQIQAQFPRGLDLKTAANEFSTLLQILLRPTQLEVINVDN